MRNFSNIKGRGSTINPANRFDDTSIHDALYLEDEEMQGDVKTEIIPVYPKTMINKVTNPDVPMEYSMNPYQGCEHGCVYCYARVTHNYWGYSAGLDFETKILVKQGAAEVLEKEIRKKSWQAAPIVLSGNTDCYQPIEKELKVTRSLIEVLYRYRNPTGFITKNAMILRDLDILEEMAKDQLVYVNMSISGIDETKRRFLEPRTSSYKNRFRTIEKLSSAGIPVRVLVGPLIPGFNSHELMDIIKMSADSGAHDCTYLPVRLKGDIADIFKDWAERHYPDTADKMFRLIADLQGGDMSDFKYSMKTKGKGNWSKILKQQYVLAKKKYFPTVEPFEFNRSLHKQYKTGQLSLF